ncbi:MAG: hypothetical protein HZA89_01965 [Verrucomicrobia bacterium]|nr:hypothetical protein [Verrucomicrobiota bacterium]
MAENIIPKNQDDLLALVHDMAGGLRRHETALGVKQNTASRMTAVADNLRGTELAFRQALADWSAARSAVKAADAALARWLTGARGLLAIRFGERWNSKWEAAGFPDRKTSIPTTQAARLALAASLQKHLADHPELEVAQLALSTVAAQAQHETVRAARAELNRTTMVRAAALKARDTAYDQLRRRAQGLVGELGCLMDENDARWRAFGLNLPGAGQVPEPVEEFTVRPDGPGAVRVTWLRARRAEYCRLFAQVAGVDAAMSFRLRVKGREARLEGLPSGRPVRVQLIAANETGEAAPSEVNECVVE